MEILLKLDDLIFKNFLWKWFTKLKHWSKNIKWWLKNIVTWKHVQKTSLGVGPSETPFNLLPKTCYTPFETVKFQIGVWKPIDNIYSVQISCKIKSKDCSKKSFNNFFITNKPSEKMQKKTFKLWIEIIKRLYHKLVFLYKIWRNNIFIRNSIKM